MITNACKNISLQLGFLTLLIVSAVPAQAIEITAVSGSGTYSPGDTFIIFGEDFGQKNPVTPIIWDNFENGTPGENVSGNTLGSHNWRLSNEPTFYSTERVYNGNQSAQCDFIDHWNGGLAVQWGLPAQQYAFASMKIRYSAADIDAPNRKHFRLTSATNNDFVHGYPNVKSGSDRDHSSVELSYANNGKEYLGYGNHNSGWNSYQLIGKFGEMGVPEGYAGVRLNGQLYADDPVTWENEEYFHNLGFTTAAFCCYISGGSSPYTIYLDDCYADISLARVEIVGPSGIHEMQIPINWSSGEVRVIFNNGQYSEGTQVSLYVYNPDNQRSNSFPITVGEGGGTPGDPPGPPGQPEAQP